nr:Na+/H+ antiporter NhaC family protein [Peptoniphilus raoultii]
MFITNPVVVSVVVLLVLCLIKIPVFFSLMIAAIVAGLTSGIDITTTMNLLFGGMGANSNTALYYILLGSLAYIMEKTGASEIMAYEISKAVKSNKFLLYLIMIIISILAESVIPIHIAFIPIIIPPLLAMMNKMKIDRRMLSVSFGFGLKAPYIAIPLGYGKLFHDILETSFGNSGLEISASTITGTTWIIALIIAAGVTLGLIFFSRNREYADKNIKPKDLVNEIPKLNKDHVLIFLSGLIVIVIQILTESLPLGALCGLIFLVVTGVVKIKNVQDMLNGGISMMGFIAFVMLIAAGFANIVTESDAVDSLVKIASSSLGSSKIVASYIMIVLGLTITLGIGTSFGTVPIVASIYVPLAQSLGYSTRAIILLITIAEVCGDAGLPSPNTTLGPTSGLSVDGQHEHIKDTCIPQITFIGLPLIIVGGLLTAFL